MSMLSEEDGATMRKLLLEKKYKKRNILGGILEEKHKEKNM